MAGLIGLQVPKPQLDHHSIAGFDCGDPTFNQWLQECRRCYGLRGYGGSREPSELSPPPSTTRARWLFWLALTADGFDRLLITSEKIGVGGIVVHAASEATRPLYLHMGCDSSPSDSSLTRVNPAARSLLPAVL
jgi:hypothetical protein